MRIRLRLILSFLILTGFIAVTGFFSIYLSQQYLEETIGENAVLLAQETLDKIDRLIHSRAEEWQSYVHLNLHIDHGLQKALVKSNQDFEAMGDYQSYIDKKDVEWITSAKNEITPFMTELINNIEADELRKKIDYYETEQGKKVFGEVFVTNKYGANVAQTGKTSDYYQGDEIHFQKAKENGLYVGDVEYDESAEIFSLDIAVKIVDEGGEFIGVLITLLNLEEIGNILDEIEKKDQNSMMHFKLLTSEGQVIYFPQEHYDFKPLDKIEDETFFLFEGDNYIISKELEPEEGEILFAWTHSKGYHDYESLGWVLLMEYETEELFAPIKNLRNFILVVSGLLVLLSLFLGIYLSNKIADPMINLTTAMLDVREGKPFRKVEKNGTDETNILIDSFNDMMSSLTRKKSQLERFVKVAVGREKKMIELKKKLRGKNEKE